MQIPSTLDGNLPSRVFSQGQRDAPLLIGERYWVTGPDGRQVAAELMSAVLNESTMTRYRSAPIGDPVPGPISAQYQSRTANFAGVPVGRRFTIQIRAVVCSTADYTLAYRNSAPPPGSDQQKQLRQMAANQYLTDHYYEGSVWIVPCLEGDNPGYSSGASIYPAVENMLLAARALGLGSTLTTRHIGYSKECDEAMGIPPNYHSYAILPIGYPMGRFGPVGRGPLSEVVYLDGWGKPYPGI